MIANNNSADVLNEGVGITLERSGGAVTLIDKLIYSNIDGISAANDIYDENTNITIANENLIGAILDNGPNQYTADATDIVESDPVFCIECKNS